MVIRSNGAAYKSGKGTKAAASPRREIARGGDKATVQILDERSDEQRGIQPKGPTNVVPFSRATQTREFNSQKCFEAVRTREQREVTTLTGEDRTNGDNALERAQGLHVAVGRGQDEVQSLLTRKAHEKSHKRDEECGDSERAKSERAKEQESKRDLAEPHDR